MKASIKFREDRQPLARAKVPVSVLGLPFLTGISAGDANELRLDLGTAFESGPSLRVCYRPNDASNPFGVKIKAGTAAMAMTAEFGLLSCGSPIFTIQIKPRLGDFFLRKSADSLFLAGSSDFVNANKKSIGSASAMAICDVLSGAELTAQSILPVRRHAVVKFRWGVRVPSEIQIKPTFLDYAERGISRWKLPVLVMSKISVEQSRQKSIQEEQFDLPFVQNRIADLQRETSSMKNALDELRARIHGGDQISSATEKSLKNG
ncbi:uncharacterized protein LOC144709341 [Wolffia australiana]